MAGGSGGGAPGTQEGSCASAVAPWVPRGGWWSGYAWARLPASCKGSWGEQSRGFCPGLGAAGVCPTEQCDRGHGRGQGRGAGQPP